MKVSELRQLSEKKLRTFVVEQERELAVTRFHVQTGQEQNTAKIKKTRKAIARAKTLLTQQG